MAIKEIRLKDFRNIKGADLELSEGTTIFYGGIGEGKTNLIEAIYLLSIGRSYRTQNSRHLIHWGKDEAAVRGEGENSNGKLSMLIKIQNEGKKVEVNGTGYSKSMELLGRIRTTLFHSEDMRIVKDEPSYRRKFLDIVISQISRNYAYSLKDYFKVLRQRNQVLMSGNRQNTEVWDEQLSSLGSWITEVREKTIKEISNIAARIFRGLRGEEAKLEMNYIKSATEDKSSYAEKLNRTRSLDIAKGITGIGPHRDDLEIKVNGRDARLFASSGEQKVITLSMKMAEAEFIKGMAGEEPVLLLDDVFAAIDEPRSRSLLKGAGSSAQRVITTTDISSIQKDVLKDAKLYEIKDGGAVKR